MSDSDLASLQDDQWRERIHEELLRKMAKNQAFDKAFRDASVWLLDLPRPFFQGHSVETFLWAHPWLLGWGAGFVGFVKSSGFVNTTTSWGQVAVIGHSLGSVIMFDLMQKARPHLYLSYRNSRDGLQCCGIQGLERLPHGLHCSQKVCFWHILELVKLFSFQKIPQDSSMKHEVHSGNLT